MLFVTCLVDQVWPAAGHAAVALLRRAGCEVGFDPRQTCCGQPGYNSGHHGPAEPVAQHTIAVLDDGDDAPIVVPSGSCAAMLRHLPARFTDPDWRARAERVAARTRELGSFLVDDLGFGAEAVAGLGARRRARVTWHDACHGLRDLGIAAQPRALLAGVRETVLVEAERAATCCGFGGTFAVKQPAISTAMLDDKLEEVERLGVDWLLAGDVSCLLQIDGRLRRRGSTVRAAHLAEYLAASLGAA